MITALNGIGEVTPEKKSTIENIRSKYNALSDTAKQYVGENNLHILEEAEARLNELIGG